MRIGGLGSVERAVGSNASAAALDLFQWFKGMPLLGVTSKGEKAIASRAGAIKEAFSEETKEAAKVLSARVDSLNADDGLLQGIANAHNTAKGLSGDNAVSREQISKELNRAYNTAGEKERATALSGVASKYDIGEDNMSYIGDTMSMSNKLADTYYKASTAPFGMIKDYALDGSPLSVYAKGAVAVTAAQFMGGSRTSLTEQNGQRDIAGIPFI